MASASRARRAVAASRVPEGKARGLLAMPPPAWTFLTGPLSSLSSTELRSKARERGQRVARKPQKAETDRRAALKPDAGEPGNGAHGPRGRVSEPPQAGVRPGARRLGSGPAPSAPTGKLQGS